KQFQHDGRDASEMTGAEASTEMVRDAPDIHNALERRRAHFSYPRREDDVDLRSRAHLGIRFQRSWVLVQVVFTIELERVDEDADDDDVALGAGEIDQPLMPFMERTHRWHKPDAPVGASSLGHAIPHLRDRRDYIRRHLTVARASASW